MSFEINGDNNIARENFSKSLLYCLYKIAGDLGFADKRIAATDTQKKNIIMDMYHSNVITVPDFYKDYSIENPTFEDLAGYVFDSYIFNVGQGQLYYEFGIKNDRRTEVVKVESPSLMESEKAEDCFAFAYMPVKGFVVGPNEEASAGFPLHKKKKETVTKNFVKGDQYSTEASDKETFDYVRRSLNNVFNELGDLGITKDSKEFQELHAAVQSFKDKMNQMVREGESSVITLNNFMVKKDRSDRNLMDYFNAYVEAKGKESGDLSSKQVTRLNACGRMQALFEKIQDIAWQEKYYYPEENKIQELRKKIDEQQEDKFKYRRSSNNKKQELEKAGPSEKAQKEAEAAEADKKYNDILDSIKEKENGIAAAQRTLDTIEKNHPEHKRYNGFLGSDRFKDAIAGKLLVARLQELDPAAMKKALTDKAIYADLFAKIKESPEFRNKTVSMTRDEVAALSKKSPSDILKKFTPRKIGLTKDDQGVQSDLQAANNINNMSKSELYAITGYLLHRSSKLLKELKEADSTFHSSSHKKFEASLKNMHKKILDLGNRDLNKLSFEDLKDAMLDTAFAAQTYQCLHQGKTLANGGLSDNIRKRMAVASEIGIIYDYISSPDSSAKTCKGLLTELCAFKAAKDTMENWIKDPDFKTNMAAYVKTGENAGKAAEANTFASDITNYKLFRDREVKEIGNNEAFKKKVINGQNAGQLQATFEGNDKLVFNNFKFKQNQVEKAAELV